MSYLSDPDRLERQAVYVGNGEYLASEVVEALTDAAVRIRALQVSSRELHDLKARRCDGCLYGEDLAQPDAADPLLLICSLTEDDNAAMIVNDTLMVRPDHACNAWRARP